MSRAFIDCRYIGLDAGERMSASAGLDLTLMFVRHRAAFYRRVADSEGQ
jgi:hypothetical protein